jgi:transposase
MDKLPELARFSEPEKDALIAALWAEVQRLKAQLAALAATSHEPRKDAHNSSVPPSQTPKANLPLGPRTKPRREARVGRAGGGRPLHPDPDQVVIAQAKICPHCGGAVQAHEQHRHAVYDKVELPAVKPIITRVEQHGGQCPHGGQPKGGPGPRGDGARHPLWGLARRAGDVPAVYAGHQLRASVRTLCAGLRRAH